MKILITAGPTHEPIDHVRFIVNRNCGNGGTAMPSPQLRLTHRSRLSHPNHWNS